MKAMDFEEITRPTAAAKDDTLLLCENAPKPRRRVRLLYNPASSVSHLGAQPAFRTPHQKLPLLIYGCEKLPNRTSIAGKF
jgi:hypothetical protein